VLLLFQNPVRFIITRTAKEDLTIEATKIRAGGPAMLMLDAANRDPAHFDNPNVFDLSPENHSHRASWLPARSSLFPDRPWLTVFVNVK
jgi:cytochrome P450